MNIKKLCRYSHNKYPTDIVTDTDRYSFNRELLPVSYLSR